MNRGRTPQRVDFCLNRPPSTRQWSPARTGEGAEARNVFLSHIHLFHFHSLREAAKPVYEADRQAKKELKKQVRGIRLIEREVEQQENEEGIITRKYCLAVRSALTDGGHPPLSAPGLKLY